VLRVPGLVPQESFPFPSIFHSEIKFNNNEFLIELEKACPLAIFAFEEIELIPTKINAERTPITTITTNISIKVKDLFIIMAEILILVKE
jgi:hypothetical protein